MIEDILVALGWYYLIAIVCVLIKIKDIIGEGK